MTDNAHLQNKIWRIENSGGISPSGVTKATLWTGAALTAWINWVVVKDNFNDYMYSNTSPLYGISRSVSENKATKDLVETITKDVCREIHSTDFFSRFFEIYRDSNGNILKKINSGSVLIPLGIETNQKCSRKMTVEVILPSAFSRRFANIKSLTPEDENIIIEE
jgi:hypothetical protein